MKEIASIERGKTAKVAVFLHLYAPAVLACGGKAALEEQRETGKMPAAERDVLARLLDR